MAKDLTSLTNVDHNSTDEDRQTGFVDRSAKRVRQTAEREKVSYADLLRATGVSSSAFANYWTGKRPWPLALFSEIADRLSTSMDYLAGRRSIGRDEEDEDITVQIDEIDMAYGLGGSFADGEIGKQTHRFPQAWLEAITRTPPSLLFFARGRGDSMTPTISDGDMVMIDRSQRSVREQDAMWALTVGEIAMIKRVRVHGDRIELLSDNDRVPPYDAVQEELNIVGRVIFIGRRI